MDNPERDLGLAWQKPQKQYGILSIQVTISCMVKQLLHNKINPKIYSCQFSLYKNKTKISNNLVSILLFKSLLQIQNCPI